MRLAIPTMMANEWRHCRDLRENAILISCQEKLFVLHRKWGGSTYYPRRAVIVPYRKPIEEEEAPLLGRHY